MVKGRRKFLVALGGAAGGLVIAGIGYELTRTREKSAETSQTQETVSTSTRSGQTTLPLGASSFQVEKILGGLNVPWSMEFAPDGRLFFTERRNGRISYIDVNAQLRTPKVFATLPSSDSGEGGLLGLALSPSFESDHFAYVYYTYSAQGGGLRNRIVRLRERDGIGQDDQTILDGVPGAAVHDGGRMRFGPDGKLYVTTGDSRQPSSAQDLKSPSGKILRLNPDGSNPSENPFPNSPVYSYGHRNPQGIDWDPTDGWLYESEHGPSGEMGFFAHDEINLIQPGKNYGWPKVVGTSNDPQYVNPIYQTGDTTWAPSGCSFYNGDKFPAWKQSLFVATLRGVHLHRLELDTQTGGVLAHESLLQNQFGRLRDVIQGPDGFLYILTSNRDGRGSPASDDDRLLRLIPV